MYITHYVYRSSLTFIITISEHISLECHTSIYRHPLYNAKGEFSQRWRYKGGGLYIYYVYTLCIYKHIYCHDLPKCAFHANTNTQSRNNIVIKIINLTIYSSAYNMQRVQHHNRH